MDIELIEIREFVEAHPPFDRLPSEALERLPRRLVVRYLRRGSAFPPEEDGGGDLYLVRSGAVELRDSGGELVERFGEGELYASPCLDDRPGEEFAGRVVEDALFYLLPCHELRALRDAHPDFDAHFAQSVRERLHRALEVLRGRRADGGLLTAEVAALATRAPVSAAPDISIREAARIMSREGVSALLLMEGESLAGIVTDRDLRRRCIADGVAFDRPVAEIMSRELHTVRRDTPAFEALIAMTRLGVGHLPVVEGERVVGMVSTTDLVHFQSANSAYLAGDVRRCRTREALVAAARGLPELQLQLVGAGVSASQLGEAVSSVTDALVCRLIELAEEKLGPPPLPYAWLVGGSQGRREQTVHGDQDSALLIADGYDEAAHGGWFSALAAEITAGMDACGFPYCPGEVMASNPRWRQSWSRWRADFDDWITSPEPKSLMLACNFFDMRAVYGEARLHRALHEAVVAQARDNRIFLAHLAANAMHAKPPLGLFRNFVLISDGEHDKSLDLKGRGLMPLVDLARVHALSAGVAEINSLERLRGASAAGELSGEGAEELAGAMELIATLRARHQAERIKRGKAPDNYLRPDALTPTDRRHLKEAFGVIKAYQQALAQAYQTERFF